MNKLIFMSLVLVGRGGGSFDTVGAAGDAGEAGSAGSITGGAGNGGGDAGNSGGGIAGTGGGTAGSAGAPTTCEGLAESDFGGTNDLTKGSNIYYCNSDSSINDGDQMDVELTCSESCSVDKNCGTYIEFVSCPGSISDENIPNGCKKITLNSNSENGIICSTYNDGILYFGTKGSVTNYIFKYGSESDLKETKCNSVSLLLKNVCTKSEGGSVSGLFFTQP